MSDEIRPGRGALRLRGGRAYGICRPRPDIGYQYPKGHPCHGCPYTFPTPTPSCTMGGGPEDCPWAFYKRLMQKKR